MMLVGAAALLLAAATWRAVPAGAITLDAAQAEARERAPEAAELEARLRGAEVAVAPASRALRVNPELSASWSPGALNGGARERSITVGVSQRLDLSGSWGPRRRSAEMDVERARQAREEGLRTLDEAVAITFAELAHAQRQLTRTERVSVLAAVALDAARKQLEVGQGTQLDVDAAYLDGLAANVDAGRARGAIASRRIRLARLLGRASAEGLVVAEGPEQPVDVTLEHLEDRVSANHLVRAARAEEAAAGLEAQAQERSAWPQPLFGIGYSRKQREIPAGAFSGPGGAGLSAAWTEDEGVLMLGVPLPLFERNQLARARATARLAQAITEVGRAEADVRTGLREAAADVDTSWRALVLLQEIPRVLDREYDLLEKAFRSGELDTVARAVALRRLQESAARYDAAVRDYRVAVARWVHVSGDGPR